MKVNIFWLLATIFLLLLACNRPQEIVRTQPNIVFILVDDQRNDVLGCAGHPIVQTPNVDKLAASGIRFANAYVTTSICAASRASIFTGLYESSHGYTFGRDPLGLNFTMNSYPMILKRTGYETGFVGKFGVLLAEQDSITDEMFDYFRPSPMNAPHFVLQPDSSYRHSAEVFGDFAVEFLERQTPEKPFCLSISFNSVHAVDNNLEPGLAGHYPYPVSTNHLYEGLDLPMPRLSDPEIFSNHPDFLKESLNRIRYFWRWDTAEKYQINLRAYYRMISGYDNVIGRVVKSLEEQGLSDNTIIIYSADNGYYMGNRGFAGKWSHYEESLRVPFIIYDPHLSEAQRGNTRDDLVLNIDIPATILEYAGVAIPAQYQGTGLASLITGTNSKWRRKFFIEHRMAHKQIPKYVGLHDQRYVYANYYEQDPPYEYLHDLKTDPDQLRNLAFDEEYNTLLESFRQRTKTFESTLGSE